MSFTLEYWRFYYLRGFTYWYFLERNDLASKDLTYASKLPDAPPFIASIASRLLAAENDPRIAIAFLHDLVKETKDPTARKALSKKLRRLKRDFLKDSKSLQFKGKTAKTGLAKNDA